MLAGLVVLERFPLDLAAEAVLGSSAVEASVTGRVRLELPLNNPLAGRIDVATERLLLQRGSRASEGDVALVYADRTLNVERAIFRGPGVWQAEGTLGQQGLNFRLDARNADFGPLLGLVPQFAALDLGAQGSLSLTAGGNLSSPTVALDSPALDVSLGETRYTLRALQVRLAGDDLSASADLIASGAASGTLALRGSGQLDLSPYQVGDLQIRVDGGLELPTIGQLGDLRARIFADTPGNWQLDASGSLGTPFTLRGRLNPLDLRLSGDDLALQAPRLFVASSSSDVDLRLRSQLGQFLISGAVRADQAELALAEAEESPEESEPNPLFTRIRFDNVAIVAPQQVLFRENFGNAEVALDLLLGGSVAAPTLQGSAQILRGTLRFSGQGFDVTSGVARFETSRGVFPAFEVRAVTRFQKRRVLNPRTNDIEFVEPRRSEDFEVFLDISGEFVPQEDASNRLELSTRLSSDARIQPPAQSTARPLRQPELLSLITVGRLELTPSIAGRGGLAGSVAEGAVDTAVDLYFLGELQQAIGDALGVEVFEIETSSVSALLGGSALFGLSLRVGGYLSDDVFASFRVGSFDDPAQRFAFSNEVTLRYELDPLEFVLSGGVNFFEDAALAPAPELNAALNYSITARTDVEAGLELSNEAQALRFGLTVRW
ncbi:MAG: translocation/assembly module TamB domain-containing protein [Trueperaceae bacterium]|nr:translocation/assembly module TamB domain-containing protein [Trueperaceae bacterium]